MLRKLVLALALSLSHADNLRATRSRGRTLQEVNLVPEDEAADLKKQEEAQREKAMAEAAAAMEKAKACLLYTSPSPRDGLLSRMPSSA